MNSQLSTRDALIAIHQLIVEAKTQAYKAGAEDLATFLNDMELLPEFLADTEDRTEEFLEMLSGIAKLYPRCGHIIEEIDRKAAIRTGSERQT